jgi:hypothetical protein
MFLPPRLCGSRRGTKSSNPVPSREESGGLPTALVGLNHFTLPCRTGARMALRTLAWMLQFGRSIVFARTTGIDALLPTAIMAAPAAICPSNVRLGAAWGSPGPGRAAGRLLMPDSPSACTRSSTRRVDTPPIQASWVTAISALSELGLLHTSASTNLSSIIGSSRVLQVEVLQLRLSDWPDGHLNYTAAVRCGSTRNSTPQAWTLTGRTKKVAPLQAGRPRGGFSAGGANVSHVANNRSCHRSAIGSRLS